MISFQNLQFDPGIPVYLQIALHVKRQILLGTACDGEELPSRREIAMQANVNPNTVQKAYRLMEDEGYVWTNGNRPSVLHLTPAIREAIETELTRSMVQQFVATAQKNNLSYKKTIALLSELWEE